MPPVEDRSRRHVLGTTPRADESLVGFVFRLALRRGMPTGSMLAAQAGIKNFASRPDEAGLSRLAAVAGVEVTELQAISYGPWDSVSSVFRGLAVHTTLLKGHVAARRVCPECLAESPYHRAVWDLSFVSACPVHAREMVYACPDCGRPLRWLGSDLTRCGYCRGSLVEVPPPRVDPELLDGTAAAYGILGEQRFVGEARAALSLPPLRDLEPMEAFEFVYRLGMDLTAGSRRKMFSLEHPGEMDHPPQVALYLGLAAVRDWPDTFLRTPAIIMERWTPSSWSPRRLWLAAIARWLDRLPPGRGLRIREAVEAIVAAGDEPPLRGQTTH